MSRQAVIGPQIYNAVNRNMERGMSVSEAITQVAGVRGATKGNVSAQYYSQRRLHLNARPAAKTQRPAGSRSSSPAASELYDDVNAEAERSGIGVTEAIRRTAALRGVTRAAVNAAYYAERKRRGVTTRRSRVSKAQRSLAAAAPARRVTAQRNGHDPSAEIDRLAADVVLQIAQLTGLVQQQTAEIAELNGTLGRVSAALN